jgi:hypothetical protein
MGIQFKFRKNDNIGAAGAEEDTEFLKECFVDTGDMEILIDPADRRQIIIGRTGAGKSAILSKLKENKTDHVIEINPDNLALTHIANSTILNFFADIGVNLDPFFKLLWRHIFTVEVLEKYFQNHDYESKNIWQQLRARYIGNSRSDKEAKEALDYLEKWGSKFWIETEFKVKEITKKLEDDLSAEASAKLGVNYANIQSELSTKKKISEEQRYELQSRGQQIVSQTQVQDLNSVIQLLDTILKDRQKIYYIVIDRLDENWVEEKLRYKLIIALILTARDFIKVRNAKAIIAMRKDLLERVFRVTRDSGFQEEKYESLYLRLVWNPESLLQILDTRINTLVSKRYTKSKVTHQDFLPPTYQKTPISKFITDRTERPRDIIDFFNKCILAGDNLSQLTSNEFKLAEGDYSRSRLKALGDEWSADYPNLLDYVLILNKKPQTFKVNLITEDQLSEICLTNVANKPEGSDSLHNLANKYVDCDLHFKDFRNILIQTFYKVGLKLETHEKTSWVNESGRSVSSAEISEEISLSINKVYHRALGIKNSN